MGENEAIVTNRKALQDFFILEAFEAGIELKGSEIKSLRQRQANLKDGFAKAERGEVYLYNFHITPYEFARRDEIDPVRARKLILKKSQIAYLAARAAEKGLSIIPLKVYLKRGLAKVEIALAKEKKMYDKRDAIRKKEARREIDRALRRKST